jgi:hypothetical protein
MSNQLITRIFETENLSTEFQFSNSNGEHRCVVQATLFDPSTIIEKSGQPIIKKRLQTQVVGAEHAEVEELACNKVLAFLGVNNG